MSRPDAANTSNCGPDRAARHTESDVLTCPAGHSNDDNAGYCSTCGVALRNDTGAQQHRRRSIVRVVLAGAGVALVSLGALAAVLVAGTNGGDDTVAPAEISTASSPSSIPPSRLVAGFDTCDADDVTEVVSLADGGSTILIDTRTEYGATQPVNCLFAVLGTSAAITSQVSATTSMMGVQEADEDGLSYKWSYHPDNGLNLIITDVSR